MKQIEKSTYFTPLCDELDFFTEGLLCGSPDGSHAGGAGLLGNNSWDLQFDEN